MRSILKILWAGRRHWQSQTWHGQSSVRLDWLFFRKTTTIPSNSCRSSRQCNALLSVIPTSQCYGLIASMILPLVFLAAIAAVFLHLTFGLVRNIQKARAIGLPYVLSPIHELELLAWITDPIIRWHCRTSLLREQGWPKWARFMVRDWHYEDQGRAHEEYGPAFCVVTPGGLVCYANDPDIAMRVATRRKAFIKPPRRMSM